MKKILLSCLGAFSFLALSSQTILFDQTNTITNSGTVAQDFEAINDAFDCAGAEDFEVPTGETWYIDSIVLYGFYAAQNNDPFTTVSGINIGVFNDNNGTIGSQVFADVVSTNVDDNQDGAIKYVWNTPLQLTAGEYWVTGAARKDFGGGGGQWYWFRTTSSFDEDFLWQNPGAGFNLGCTTWSSGQSCLTVTEDGLAFRVYGCFSPNKPTIDPLPADTAFCDGGVFSVSANSNSSNVVYLWNTGFVGPSIDITQDGYYRVYAYDTITECGVYEDVNVTVIPSPDPNLSDTSSCTGPFTITAFSGPNQTYQWHTGSTGEFYFVSNTQTVSVTVTDTVTGCVATDTAFMEVIDNLNPVLSVQSPYGLCQGDSVNLFTADPYDTYNWSTNQTSPSIIVWQAGTYTVTVTDGGSCTGSATVEVISVPPPQVTIDIDTFSNGNLNLQVAEGYSAYEWSNGDTIYRTTATESGLYGVTVTDEYGCTGSSSAFLIVNSVEEILSESDVQLHPNPAKDRITISITDEIQGKSSAVFMDLNGRVLKTIALDELNNQVDLNGLARGYYLIRIESEKGIVAQPLIIN